VSTLRAIGEFEAIRRLIGARERGARVRVGPGDDAAILVPRAGRELAVTTDAFVEDRHWRAGWITPAALGARLAAANLSDLAAMAARPAWALLSYGLRPSHRIAALLALQRGAAGTLAASGAAIVGGNLTAVRGAEWVSLTLIGEVRRGRAWARAGARAGDALAVTGHPGRAGAAVRLARRRGMARVPAPLRRAWRAPRPRIAFAAALADARAVHAAIDLSDGLAGDLARLCAASGIGAELDAAACVRAAALGAAPATLRMDPLALALGASDDYELLLAIAPARLAAARAVAARQRVPLTVIGRVSGPREGLVVRAPDGRRRALASLAAGFDHFGGPAR